MVRTATSTRSHVGDGSGRDAEVRDYVLDAKTGVITKGDGTCKQMWVLVLQNESAEDPLPCGAIHRSTSDGGDVICLRSASEKVLGVDAVTKHDAKTDVVRTCWTHRGLTDEGVSKYEFCVASIWKFVEVACRLGMRICSPKTEGPATAMEFLGLLVSKMKTSTTGDPTPFDELGTRWHRRTTCQLT